MTNPTSEPNDAGQPGGETITYRMAFTGKAGEYFRIWIVNYFITLVTLGFYLPWAIVRNRKYLYANSWLGEDNFGFHANPVALLKGYLIVVTLALIYAFSGYVNPYFPLIVIVIILLLYPFIVWNALRFRTRNSSYRNIRFNFHGELSVAYKRFLIWALLIPFTLGLIFPYLMYLQKDYMLNNLSYGDQKSKFKGRAGRFYPPYLAAAGIWVFGVFVLFLVIQIYFYVFILNIDSVGDVFFNALIPVIAIGYSVFLLCGVIGKTLIFVKIQNYAWSRTKLGNGISFRSIFKLWPFLKIQVVNGLAIFFSLGLATPWATVRKLKYLAECMLVTADKDQLDKVIQTNIDSDTALGDAAAGYLDLDIG